MNTTDGENRKRIATGSEQDIKIDFADWLIEMANGDVPYQARTLAAYAASFTTATNTELARLSGIDLNGRADRTFSKWKRYLIENGWIAIEDGEVRPALSGIPVVFADLERSDLHLDFGLCGDNREWLRQATISAFGFQCSHCDGLGSEDLGPDGRPWCLDRIIPGKVGGEYVADNVTLSCWHCNSKRGASPIEQRTFSLADWRALRREWQDVGTSIAEVCHD